MSSTVKLSVAIVLLLGSGAWLAYYFKSQPKPGDSVEHLQPLACANCHYAWKATVGDPPVKCPKCGQLQGYRAAKCADPKCGAVTPVIRSSNRSDPGSKTPPSCYKCGGTRLVEVPPDAIP